MVSATRPRYGHVDRTARTARETIAKLARCRYRPDRPGRTVLTMALPALVLVVDDEPMVREVVAEYLRRDGPRVHELGDGAAAIEWLRDHRPDLVVLDIMLPGADGLSVLRRIRSAGDIPVILLTARTEELDRARPRAGRRRLRRQAVLPRELAAAAWRSCVGPPSRSSSTRRSSSTGCASIHGPVRFTSTVGESR